MTQTYQDLQLPPSTPRPQEDRSRQAVDASAEHLVRTAHKLSGAEPEYAEALRHSLQAIREAYTALLQWHGLTPRPDATLAELGQPAEQLVSMIRTCQNRALPLEALHASLAASGPFPLAARETVQASFYTARNTLSVVLGSLPERVTREAIWTLNRAQAIWTGRSATEQQEVGSDRLAVAASRPPARLRVSAAA